MEIIISKGHRRYCHICCTCLICVVSKTTSLMVRFYSLYSQTTWNNWSISNPNIKSSCQVIEYHASKLFCERCNGFHACLTYKCWYYDIIGGKLILSERRHSITSKCQNDEIWKKYSHYVCWTLEKATIQSYFTFFIVYF